MSLKKMFEDTEPSLKEMMEFVEIQTSTLGSTIAEKKFEMRFVSHRDASIMDAEEFYERILYLGRYLSEGVEVLKKRVEAADAKLDEMHKFIQQLKIDGRSKQHKE